MASKKSSIKKRSAARTKKSLPARKIPSQPETEDRGAADEGSAEIEGR